MKLQYYETTGARFVRSAPTAARPRACGRTDEPHIAGATPRKRSPRREGAFTMVEVAISLAVIGFALCLLVVAFGFIAPNLGSEFVPKLSEGAVTINVVRLAGTDLDESIRYNTQMEKALLKEFPDVKASRGRGRGEFAGWARQA